MGDVGTSERYQTKKTGTFATRGNKRYLKKKIWEKKGLMKSTGGALPRPEHIIVPAVRGGRISIKWSLSVRQKKA